MYDPSVRSAFAGFNDGQQLLCGESIDYSSHSTQRKVLFLTWPILVINQGLTHVYMQIHPEELREALPSQVSVLHDTSTASHEMSTEHAAIW